MTASLKWRSCLRAISRTMLTIQARPASDPDVPAEPMISGIPASIARVIMISVSRLTAAVENMQVPVASGPGPGSVLPASQPTIRTPNAIALSSDSARNPETLRLCIGRGITTGSHRAPPAALRHRLNFVAAHPSWTNVTANPTAEWIARQITEAFPWDEAPRYLIRDRDTSYGAAVTRRLR